MSSIPATYETYQETVVVQEATTNLVSVFQRLTEQ